MPCYKPGEAVPAFHRAGFGLFATEAECLEACNEGACCNGTTCSVKPQCQCDAEAGEVFEGVGTVCSPNPCGCCGDGTDTPEFLQLEISNFEYELPFILRVDSYPINGTYLLPRVSNTDTQGCFTYLLLDRPTVFSPPTYGCSLNNHEWAPYDLVMQITQTGNLLYMQGCSQVIQGGTSIPPPNPDCFNEQRSCASWFSELFGVNTQGVCSQSEPFSGSGVYRGALPGIILATFNWEITPIRTNPLP